MGDVSNEPSMEHILSSIKRIIAEDGESGLTDSRRLRSPRASLSRLSQAEEDDILELSQPMAEAPVEGEEGMAPAQSPEPQPSPLVSKPQAAAPAPSAERPAPSRDEVDPALVSNATAAASRSSLDQLSRLIMKPEITGSDTLEGMVREMLKPMLQEWLDENLPRIVETMVARETTRITGRG